MAGRLVGGLHPFCSQTWPQHEQIRWGDIGRTHRINIALQLRGGTALRHICAIVSSTWPVDHTSYFYKYGRSLVILDKRQMCIGDSAKSQTVPEIEIRPTNRLGTRAWDPDPQGNHRMTGACRIRCGRERRGGGLMLPP